MIEVCPGLVHVHGGCPHLRGSTSSAVNIALLSICFLADMDQDFTSGGTITLDADDLTGSTTIMVTDDDIFEDSETIMVSVMPDTNTQFNVMSGDTLTITITDNEGN